MESATLDDVQAFNEQLAALSAAGVPLDVDLGTSRDEAIKTLERIEATVTRRVKRGESLDEAFQGDEGDLPASYRSLVQVGLSDGNLAAGLVESNIVAASAAESQSSLASGLVYPLIVCGLAYIGLLGLCLYFEPTLAELYRDVRLEPSSGLRVLEVIRSTLPFWSVLVPIALLAIVVLLFRSRRRPTVGDAAAGPLLWLPGASRSLFQERCARFAAMLADLLESGAAFPDALRIAGDGCGDARLQASAASLASATTGGKLPEDASDVAQIPPFLRWALWHTQETIERTKALRIAARMYRETAQRRAVRFRAVAPVAMLVLVGGTVTLLYSLALFVPMVQLLYGLSR